jgi:glycosyltransferase involved in cell wall biosynthesis
VPEVWMVNQYAITPDLPGGTRHYDLATELVSRGFRVKVFASDVNLALRRRTKLQAGELYKVEAWDGVDFVWVRAAEYKGNNWRRAWNMLSFGSNFFRVARAMPRTARPDVIIGSSPHPFAALAAQITARSLGARFFLELRDLWPQALIDMGGLAEAHPGVRLMRFLERYLYARAEKLIVLAKGSQGYLEARGIHRDRVLFIPNGAHLGHFQAGTSRSEARARYGFHGFTIVYTGAHGPANSLETILRAAILVKESAVEFVLVGDGPDKERLVRLAQAEGITNVRFLAPIPKGEIPDLLSAADAGVITLMDASAFAYGISPNKLFDYMAAMRPILCSVPGDMAALVEEANAGLVCQPENVGDLAQAALRLSAMPERERQTLGQNGYDFVFRHFRREVLADRLASAIDQWRPAQPAEEIDRAASVLEQAAPR